MRTENKIINSLFEPPTVQKFRSYTVPQVTLSKKRLSLCKIFDCMHIARIFMEITCTQSKILHKYIRKTGLEVEEPAYNRKFCSLCQLLFFHALAL